jgi:hypothetical protein
MFPMRDVESREGREPRAIAFERHECGIFRKTSFDSIGEKMEPVKFGGQYAYSLSGNYQQMVNPVTNLNGVVIRTVALQNAKIFTGPVKPTSPDGGFPVVMRAGSTTSMINAFPILLPPGYGLWVWGLNGGEASVSWDVL